MLDENDLERYASQLIMPAIEEEGQSILLNSKVLIIGAGGLGNPTAIFCSATGIGNIDICDHDTIELSNLNNEPHFPSFGGKKSEPRPYQKEANSELIV